MNRFDTFIDFWIKEVLPRFFEVYLFITSIALMLTLVWMMVYGSYQIIKGLKK